MSFDGVKQSSCADGDFSDQAFERCYPLLRFHLHGGHEFDGVRQRFVSFDQFLEAFIDVYVPTLCEALRIAKDSICCSSQRRLCSGKSGLRPDGQPRAAVPTLGFLYMSWGYSAGKTILGWKRVPATRVAMASSSLCPAKTLTWRARESSGRLMGRPLRMRAAVGSSAVTEGN